jgi:hypothetical protein
MQAAPDPRAVVFLLVVATAVVMLAPRAALFLALPGAP